ncbi:hypothetical protein HBI65_198570 [Parastagonospora nodorum]|nr:hypothetical protein HBI75_076970 [Parastagonospora nodorum]KAH5510221.1 hypothetical protein HBI29_110510 [Parastagonospora nodorum]KAH5677091.1 hypothetical protein HBI21_103800 [Parastagonospora nodorum]KAH6084881.1 hypothetical protein HBI65_198570 [Parastagonospora nodorum]
MAPADQAFDVSTNSVPSQHDVNLEDENELKQPQPGVTSDQAPHVPHESIATLNEVKPEDDDEFDQPDTVSDSSTLVYDHEAFDTFRHRVAEFVLTLWDGAKASDIEVTRMSGGGFNRVISITRTIPRQQKSMLACSFKRLWTFIADRSTKMRHDTCQPRCLDYILRIPRFDAAQLDRDVAALRYVQKLRSIPVPDVVAFDETPNNKLGSPYMLQNRLSGTDLLHTFHRLDHDQKCRVAEELGRVFHAMLSRKCPVAGKLILPHTVSSSKDDGDQICVEPLFQSELPTRGQVKHNLATKDLLTEIFEERKEGFEDMGNNFEAGYMNRFSAMAIELHAEGWFANNDISVCHLDFEPRNILIDITKDAPQPIISGILDWDSAALAPSFMSCKPPLWIWAWADDEDEDEQTANDEPPNEEGRVLKRTFEQAAGPEFAGYAYPSAYRLARRLLRFAMDEMRSTEDFNEADAMLEEWAELRKSSAIVDT